MVPSLLSFWSSVHPHNAVPTGQTAAYPLQLLCRKKVAMLNINEVFQKFGEQYLEVDNITATDDPAFSLTKRNDLRAFLILDRLLPGVGTMISASAWNEFRLRVRVEDLARVATESDILNLVRCGVRYDPSMDALVMFS